MTYNPIFEEEMGREQELKDLRLAIKKRAGTDSVMDLVDRCTNFVKSHPILTTIALGVFSSQLGRKY
ncbi:MAG: hypothetical protein OXU45_09115 [Candidatus Melainabacteria bacterium]|nr:hypothetical protein [Candidatus Melainabacteria bacterium]